MPERTQAQLARLYASDASTIPDDKMEMGIWEFHQAIRAAQANYLHPVFQRVMNPTHIPGYYAEIANTLGDVVSSRPFREVIATLLPKQVERILKTASTNELQKLQQTLRTHTTPQALAEETSEEKAFRLMNGTNGGNWTFELGPLGFFSSYWQVLVEHVITQTEKNGASLSDEQLLTILSHSSNAIAAPAALLDLQHVETMLQARTSQFRSAVQAHTNVTDQGASFTADLENIHPSAGRCPMSSFGTMKQIFAFYLDASKYILQERQARLKDNAN